MIGLLKGNVIEIEGEVVIVDVNGVGYQVNVGDPNYLLEQEVTLYIHTALRENDLSLWGFKTKIEMALFNMLLGVSGVGLKTAMAIIKNLGVESVVNAILSDNAGALKVSGVGIKTAEKIIIDLRNKIESLNVNSGDATSDQSKQLNLLGNEHDDVVAALVSLGYKEYEVKQVISKFSKEQLQDLTTEGLIKEILKQI